MLDAARAKARRGELRISAPIGYISHREVGLGFDPDRRIQEVVCGPSALQPEGESIRHIDLALSPAPTPSRYPHPTAVRKAALTGGTRTATGKLIFTIIGAVGAFERELMWIFDT